MPKGRILKDLEAYILGFVSENQPCSPYYIHKAFLKSPSQFFSGSAGAIYPAVKRLEAYGFLKSSAAGSRAKPSSELRITRDGLKTYLDWYFDSPRAGDAGFDPLRGRISMLGALPEPEKAAAFDRLLGIARERLDFLDRLDIEPLMGAGMKMAMEMEYKTLKAKIRLLEKWHAKG